MGGQELPEVVQAAVMQAGVDLGWRVDMVQSGDEVLIVDDATNLVLGKITAEGERVMSDDPLPFEGEVE